MTEYRVVGSGADRRIATGESVVILAGVQGPPGFSDLGAHVVAQDPHPQYATDDDLAAEAALRAAIASDLATEAAARASADSAHAATPHPTTEQRAALEGTTLTPPSAFNKFVTDADSRLTDARTPTAHTHADKADAARPALRVYNSGNLSIATGTPTALTFDSERKDDSGMHSLASQTDRITIAEAGWYLVGVHVRWAGSSAGALRGLYLLLNASTIIAADGRAPIGTQVVDQSVGTLYYLAAGDYVWSRVTQDSGNPLNITANANYSPELWAVLISK